MRIVTPMAFVGSLLTLGALTGCGNGSSPAVTTPIVSVQTMTRGDAPVPHIGEKYTITDLGLAEEFYDTEGIITSNIRYRGVLRINDSGYVVSNTNSRPTLYDGQPRVLNARFTHAKVYSLNNASDVVGISARDRATLWSGTAVEHIDTRGSSSSRSTAYAINDNKVVVGLSSEGSTWSNEPTLATLWQNTTQTTLGTLGGKDSLAYGINLADVVIGWSQITPPNSAYDYSSPVHAFVWEQGTMTDLGVLPGGAYSDALDINDGGQIVGSSDTPPQGLYSYVPLHGVTWVNRTIQDLGTLGGPSSIAYALNNSSVIVGGADTGTVAPIVPVTTGGGGIGGGTSDINSLTDGAGGRNAALRTRGIGDIYVSHAFRYQNGKMEDLNALIALDAGWELLTATDINANGLIVGFGKHGGKRHAFLLTPKP